MNEVYNSQQIDESYSKVKKVVLEYFSNAESQSFLQTSQKLKFLDNCDSQIHQLMNFYMLKAEAASPGGSKIFLQSFQKEVFADQPKVFTKNDLKPLLTSYLSQDAVDMLHKALIMAGLKGKVILSAEASNTSQDVAELNTGSFFSEVFPAFELKSTKFISPKLVCIDGYIESVSEIHRLLEDASSTKDTVILVIRGASDDVVHTLKVNYNRQSLCVIPLVVNYDLNGINLLNDIAVVAGTDVISSLKGQLISSLDISSYPRVDSVDITSAGLLVENSVTNFAVDKHISFLQNKILSSTIDAEKSLLSKRVQSLGTNRIVIKLKNDKLKLQRSLSFDQALRAVKSATSYGVCRLEDKCLPYASLAAGKFYFKKFEETINSIGSLIV